MNKLTKNMAGIGAVLALTLFACGLFHNELLAVYLAIGELVGGLLMYLWLCVITYTLMAIWMLPIVFITVAVVEWRHRHP